jgi:hypothetical protein
MKQQVFDRLGKRIVRIGSTRQADNVCGEIREDIRHAWILTHGHDAATEHVHDQSPSPQRSPGDSPTHGSCQVS